MIDGLSCKNALILANLENVIIARMDNGHFRSAGNKVNSVTFPGYQFISGERKSILTEVFLGIYSLQESGSSPVRGQNRFLLNPLQYDT
jgi:hypothetical protein